MMFSPTYQHLFANMHRDSRFRDAYVNGLDDGCNDGRSDSQGNPCSGHCAVSAACDIDDRLLFILVDAFIRIECVVT